MTSALGRDTREVRTPVGVAPASNGGQVLNEAAFTFHGFGAVVRVSAPDWADLDRVIPWAAPELVGARGSDGPADVLLTRWNGRYRMTIGERRFGPYDERDTILRSLASGIHFVLAMRSPMTFVHAGAIELDGMALIFPGASGWGKSSLVSRLVDEGCGYLSDEFAVLSPEGTVFPLSKPIRLRGRNASYRSLPGPSARGGFPCAAIVLTKFIQGARWDPKSLTSGQAVLRTLPSTLKCSEAPEQAVEALIRAAGQSVCVRGARGEDEEPTAETLRALVRSVESGWRSSSVPRHGDPAQTRRLREAGV